MKKYILFVAMTSAGLLGLATVSHAQGGDVVVQTAGAVSRVEANVAGAVNRATSAAIVHNKIAYGAGKLAVTAPRASYPGAKVAFSSSANSAYAAGKVVNFPTKGATVPLPTVSAAQGKVTNMVTPGGTLPMYTASGNIATALPSTVAVVGDAEASAEIVKIFEGTGSYKGITDFTRLAQNLPDYAIFYNGQMTFSQLERVQNFYSGYLEGVEAFAKENTLWSNMDPERWAKMVTVMTDVGFFGRVEDVNKIYNIVKDAPKEYRMLTDFVAVRALLNMNERGMWEAGQKLVNLAWERAMEEKWLEEGTLESQKPTEMVYKELNNYLFKTNPDSPLLEALPGFNDSNGNILNTVAVEDFLARQEVAGLVEAAQATNMVTYIQFTKHSKLGDMIDFMKLKDKMPNLLPDLAR